MEIKIKPLIITFALLIFINGALSQPISITKKIKLEKNRIVVVSEPEINERPTIGLALSGGGSRGIAHIGVLKYIEKHHIPIDYIAGTSIGSFIGGLYAAGYTPDEIEHIFKTIDWNTIFSDKTERTALFMQQKVEYDRYLLSIGFDGLKPYIPNALTPGQKLLSIITKLIIKAPYQVKTSFDDLKIPFRAVATDLISGKMVVLKDGSLPESINASMVIPLLFSPVVRDSLLLVDGGLVSNLPVGGVAKMGADVVVASDMSTVLRKKEELQRPWEIADQVTTIMSRSTYEHKKKNADILIRPNIPNINNTDFSKMDSLIQAGEEAAALHFAKLDSLSREKTVNSNYPGWKIDRLEISGNMRVLPWFIAGDSVSYTTLNTFLDSLINTGWYRSVQAVIDTSGASVKLDIKAEPCAVLQKIDITGTNSMNSEKLTKLFSSQIGRQINVDTLKSDLEKLRKEYYKYGNTLMGIKDIQIDGVKGVLAINIDEGVINDIKLTGNERTKDYVILRDFNGLRNKPFDWRSIDEAMKNVYSSGLFERVGVSIKKGSGGYVLMVKVTEKSSVRMKIGGKIDNDRRAQLYLSLTDQNFLGNGIKTTLIGRFGSYDNFYALNLRNDRIFDTYLTVNGLAYFSTEINPFYIDNEEKGQYYEKRIGLKLQLGFQLFRLGQIVGEFRIEKVEDVVYDGYFNKQQNIELHTISFNSVSDSRNKRAFPTDGGYFYWMFEGGSNILLKSDQGYTKALVHLERYLSFSQIHTWHLRGDIGIGDNTLPFSENFRMGGLDNFYGYWQNELFGKQQILLSAEYRLKIPIGIFHETYISMRYDVGGVWQNPTLLISTDDMEAAMGVCLGFNTFLGPLKFAYGRTFSGKELGYLSFGLNF